MGLDSVSTRGIEIVANTNKYLDFATTYSDYQGGIIHSSTNNDFQNA